MDYHKLEDKLRFLICKFLPDFDFAYNSCWSNLIEFKNFRDKITHPRHEEDEIDINEYKKKIETGLSAAIEIMNYLCKGIFNRPLRKKILDLKI